MICSPIQAAGSEVDLDALESHQEPHKKAANWESPVQRGHPDNKSPSSIEEFSNDGPGAQEPHPNWSIWVVRLAIFADAVNSQVLGPNYALLVLEGGALESFPSTEPLGFSGANYFILMCSNFGMFISCLFFGWLSDRIGRKPCMLTCMYIGAIGSVLKFVARNNFWTFCAATFFNGLFGGSSAIGLAYASDITKDRLQKEAEIGILIATNMLGRTGGGITATLMASVGLFTPLWVSGALSLLAGVMCHMWMTESLPASKEAEQSPNDAVKSSLNTKKLDAPTPEKSDENHALDMKIISHVLAGELTDHIGSLGLVPLCLSPLMFNAFYVHFTQKKVDPIMSATAYKWIYASLAIVVVPGALVAPHLFKKFGLALVASLSNLLTGTVTLVLLYIATMEPASRTTFAAFVAVLFCAFPLTVMSQVSTGPMLDRVTPESKRGQIQGFNTAAMNLSKALGPFLYGLLTDATSIKTALYTATGVSALAGVINFLLVKDPRFQPNYENVQQQQFPGVVNRSEEPGLPSVIVVEEGRSSLFLSMATASEL